MRRPKIRMIELTVLKTLVLNQSLNLANANLAKIGPIKSKIYLLIWSPDMESSDRIKPTLSGNARDANRWCDQVDRHEGARCSREFHARPWNTCFQQRQFEEFTFFDWVEIFFVIFFCCLKFQDMHELNYFSTEKTIFEKCLKHILFENSRINIDPKMTATKARVVHVSFMRLHESDFRIQGTRNQHCLYFFLRQIAPLKHSVNQWNWKRSQLKIIPSFRIVGSPMLRGRCR